MYFAEGVNDGRSNCIMRHGGADRGAGGVVCTGVLSGGGGGGQEDGADAVG